MILENCLTERLRFRPLTLADKPHLLAFFHDAQSSEFIPLDDNLEAFADAWLARQLRRYENGSGGLHAVELRKTGEFIGQCGLVRQFVDGIPKWEVGYHFLRPHWRQGYATEAAIACRDFCFENEMAETLISIIHADNLRSLAVAARNGMTFWKNTEFKGELAQVYRIRREEWDLLEVGSRQFERNNIPNSLRDAKPQPADRNR